MLKKLIFVYLNDILIFSRDIKEHIQHVHLVLKRLLENKLFIKVEKCEFHVLAVSFLGFMIEQGQIRTDPAKIQAVSDRTTPSTRKQLQCCLGCTNFQRRFIQDYSRVAAPLTQLASASPFLLDS